MMNRQSLILTIGLQAICWGLIIWIFIKPSEDVQAIVLFQSSPTPAPFLGPIYYGKRDVWNVFDHDKPLASTGEDGNENVTHHNGATFLGITPTPAGTPYIPVDGFGYDEHGGIDYSLEYVPVLAAANGTVIAAGWENESNHRDSYGLRVRIDHGQYDTIYGHLSVLTVETGDPVEANPEDRNSIIGISGNTGLVFGGCGDVGDDPTCGAHLHFEVRDTGGYKPVNPYGWMGLTPLPIPSATPIEDPWANDPNGAVSYKLWLDYPALVSGADQYLGTNSTPILEPAVNNARMIIDDGSADFFPGPCWTFAGGSQSYNNGYHRAASDGEDNCTSRWTIRRDAFTEPGEYDVFVHIPPDANPSLSVAYDVHHNNQVSRAIAVQAAYVYNEEHDAWVYLGRYDFAMSDNVTEFVLVHDHDVFDEDDGRYTLADAIMLAPAGEEASLPPPQRYFYVSFSQDGYAGNVPYADEDVLLFDAHTGEWRMFFDGSDVGLSSVDVDAFAYKSDNLYFSTGQSFGGGGFTNADIIHFAPTSLGEETSGTMSIYLTGEKVGLTEDDDIDALAFNGQGDVLLSVKDPVTLNGNDFEDEDLFVEDPDNPGGATLFFDGSAKQLNDYSEDVDGVWLAPGNDIYLSTEGTFAVSGSGTSGDGTDIFICSPGFTGDCLYGPGLFWNGSAHGVGTTATVDDFFVHDNYLIDDCQTFGNGGFEGQFYCWERTIFPNPIEGEWRPTTVDKHSGQYSAEARIEVIYNQTPTIFLTSSPIPVEESTAYRFRFWAKTIADAPYENMQVYASIYWYSENTYQEEEFADIDYSEYPEWTQLTSGFLCPPSHEVNSARIVFALVSHTLFGTTNDGVGSIFIDDVMWESQPCNPDLVRKLKC